MQVRGTMGRAQPSRLEQEVQLVGDTSRERREIDAGPRSWMWAFIAVYREFAFSSGAIATWVRERTDSRGAATTFHKLAAVRHTASSA